MCLVKFVWNEYRNGALITNFPYLAVEAIEFLRSVGVECICVNTPSLDAETNPNLDNHKAFFRDGDNLIIELIDATEIESGSYIVNIGLYPTDTDAFPVIVKC